MFGFVAYGLALRRWADACPAEGAPWRREGHVLCLLAAWQLHSGLSNVVLGWPLLSALAHTLGAALLVWRLVHLRVCPRQALQRQAGSHARPVVPDSPSDSGMLHV